MMQHPNSVGHLRQSLSSLTVWATQ